MIMITEPLLLMFTIFDSRRVFALVATYDCDYNYDASVK